MSTFNKMLSISKMSELGPHRRDHFFITWHFPTFCGKVEGSCLVKILWTNLASFGLLSSIFQQCLQMVSINFLLKRSLPLWHDSCRPSVTDRNQACAKLLYISWYCLMQGIAFPSYNLIHLSIKFTLRRCKVSSCRWMVFNCREMTPKLVFDFLLFYQQVRHVSSAFISFCEAE